MQVNTSFTKLIELCEDLPWCNHFICATKDSLVPRTDFLFQYLKFKQTN